MPGQVTIRIRYQRLATGWFDLLWMSLTELDQIAAAAGWRVTGAPRSRIPGGLGPHLSARPTARIAGAAVPYVIKQTGPGC
jgi:hypothetical protein